MPKDFTLEINPSHSIIINLNILRKQDPQFAKELSLTFLDQILIGSSIPLDIQESSARCQTMIDKYLDEALANSRSGGALHEIIQEAEFEAESQGSDESVLKKVRKEVRQNDSGKKIFKEYKVTGNEKIEK